MSKKVARMKATSIITRWIKNIRMSNSIKSTIVASIVLLFILEGVSALFYYHKNKSPVQNISSSVAAIQWVVKKVEKFSLSVSPKFNRLVKLREAGIDAFPTYFFEPLLHHPTDFYHLSNVPESYLVYCRESGEFAEWTSDELGFRNPSGQVNSKVDFLFIGDSFVEGACVSNENTFGGVFRSNGKRVFNLGRGGSGPLFNLATLTEYGDAVDANTVIWFVFTGNDLQDLRQEKTTKLSRYLVDDYSQNLLLQKDDVTQNLKFFLENEMIFQKTRTEKNKDFLQPQVEYGIRIDEIETKFKEVPLLLEVASMIKKKANGNGSNLAIVIINHPRYNNFEIQDSTSAAIRQFSMENEVPFIEFSREYLATNWKKFYGNKGPHFNSRGYLSVGAEIFSWIDSENLTSKTIIKNK